jgi:EmrB/QacA subfamily drug resistance transporter
MLENTPVTAVVTAASPVKRVRSVRFIALIIASALFMEGIDSTVLATALPTMAHSFHTEPLRMNVALTAYLLSLAVFIPVSGRVADRFGTCTVFRAAIFMFVFGSVLCAQSDTVPLLVASRIVQGIGGAMMTPVGRLVLLKTVSKSELVTAMAWLLVPATAGPILGPPLGGLIVTYFTWQWIFYINVPAGIIGIILATLYVDEVREPNPPPIDFLGLGLSGLSLSCLIFGLETGSHGVSSLWFTFGLLGVGVVSGLLYLLHSRGMTHPILDFRLMRISTFQISMLAGSLSRIAVGAVPFLLPMMLQLGFGESPARSGAITLAGSIGSLAMRPVAPRMLRQLGFRNTLIWVGLGSTLLLGVSAAFRPDWSIAAIYVVLIGVGFLQSLQFMAYNTVAYADVPRPQMSSATSFYTTFQQIALTLGIGVSAATLAASVAITGHDRPLPIDFSVAYLVVATIAMFAPLVSTRLDPYAGAELSGQSPSEKHMKVTLEALLRGLRRRK